MQSLQDTPLLKFNPNTVNEVRKLFDLDTPGRMEEAIKILEEWIQKQGHFLCKDFDRDYLERFIIMNKGLLERAKSRMDKICTFRTLSPNFFGVYNLKEDDIFKGLDCLKAVVLPKQTPDHYRIYFVKMVGNEWTSSMFINHYKRLVVCWEYLLKHDYSTGFVVIMQVTEADLPQLIAKIGWNDMRQIINIFLEGYSMRLKGWHFISQSKLVDTFMALFKQVVSEKIASRIYKHRNIEEIYDVIPKDLLPSDLGGKEKTLAEIEADWENILSTQEHIDYVKKINEARTDESQRPVDTFNEQYLGTSGSFRSLVVD